MKYQGILAVLFCILFSFNSIAEEAPYTPEQQKYLKWAKTLWESLDRKHGEVKLIDGVASLNVPESFYYLNPTDTQKVLVEVWGNPPGKETLGMLLPEGSTPFDQSSWGVTIEYAKDGYVSDEDADDIDYDDLLSQMKSDTREESKKRVEQGYEGIELLGWAAKPYYDQSSHKLHWAKEYKFSTQEEHTLNYNIRILGRKGVLVLNFIAGMESKGIIEQNLDDVLSIAKFDQGSTYADFDPDVDTMAAYGLGALVAGKAAAKAGFFAAALIFLKKFGVYILIGFGILIKKLLGRKKASSST